MVDAHCHLNFQTFDNDVNTVIKDAFDAGVKKIVNVGTKLDSSEKAVELARDYENLYAIVGVHPHHADKLEIDWEKQLETLAKNKKVIAIGECGMDYFRYKSNGIVDPGKQREIFVKQIEIASILGLPLQIHNRRAEKDVCDILLAHKNMLHNPPGMIHCFSGSIDFLKKVLDLGFYVGFDGNITYKGRAPGEETDLRDLVAYAPIDRILTETDSPYLTPQPFRGARNTPKNVIIIAEFIAKLKQISFELLAGQIEENFSRVFQNAYDDKRI